MRGVFQKLTHNILGPFFLERDEIKFKVREVKRLQGTEKKEVNQDGDKETNFLE